MYVQFSIVAGTPLNRLDLYFVDLDPPTRRVLTSGTLDTGLKIQFVPDVGTGSGYKVSKTPGGRFRTGVSAAAVGIDDWPTTRRARVRATCPAGTTRTLVLDPVKRSQLIIRPKRKRGLQATPIASTAAPPELDFGSISLPGPAGGTSPIFQGDDPLLIAVCTLNARVRTGDAQVKLEADGTVSVWELRKVAG